MQIPFRKLLNNYIFLKKGFSFFNHLAPFTIVSILSIILSLPPAEELLIKLASKLDKPNFNFLLNAIIVISISIIVYFLSILSQINKTYLISYRKYTKAIVTSLLFIILCTSIAFLTLITLKNITICAGFSFGNIFASLFLASISLVGVGWKLPALVEATGIKLPDYSEAHNLIKDIGDILETLYSGGSSDDNLVKDYFSKNGKLLEYINKQKHYEPSWAKKEIEDVGKSLRYLINEEKYFTSYTSNLASVIRGQLSDDRYKQFISHFNNLIYLLPEWKYR